MGFRDIQGLGVCYVGLQGYIGFRGLSTVQGYKGFRGI